MKETGFHRYEAYVNNVPSADSERWAVVKRFDSFEEASQQIQKWHERLEHSQTKEEHKNAVFETMKITSYTYVGKENLEKNFFLYSAPVWSEVLHGYDALKEKEKIFQKIDKSKKEEHSI